MLVQSLVSGKVNAANRKLAFARRERRTPADLGVYDTGTSTELPAVAIASIAPSIQPPPMTM
jgi:hypothetical protein